MKNTLPSGYGIPIAITIAGLLIAGAVIFSSGGSTATSAESSDPGHAGMAPSDSTAEASARAGEFRMPNSEDHIRGDLDAPIKIVEFSDFECPFCGRLHPILSRVVEENDDVAWVYRHFPLNSHTNAFSAAVASECVARVGGNEAFWDFADTAFANRRQLNDHFYDQFVQDTGLDTKVFISCINNDAAAEEVQRDLDEVTAVGGRGTPYVVVVAEDGELIPFSGALPYGQVMGVIERARQ